MNASNPAETNKEPLVVKHGQEETIKALGSEITFLCRKPGAWSLTRVSVPRDVGAPPHDHDFDESYYVMSGSLRLMVAGREIELNAGEFILIPGKTVHGFKGTSDAPTQILILQAPGDADAFFRACAQEIKKIPEDLARMPEVGARYGIRMAPPSHNAPPR